MRPGSPPSLLQRSKVPGVSRLHRSLPRPPEHSLRVCSRDLQDIPCCSLFWSGPGRLQRAGGCHHTGCRAETHCRGGKYPMLGAETFSTRVRRQIPLFFYFFFFAEKLQAVIAVLYQVLPKAWEESIISLPQPRRRPGTQGVDQLHLQGLSCSKDHRDFI